ncbi:exosome complex RNA-binding protein Csl4 [Candidatus Bathyarchaeota archaeon]|nr:exosome complex RNA-binding protein Csl4 [Candidatus Bathyarchaeota archaeon]
MSEAKRSGQFVTPGERLGVIEEFIPGYGTYVEQSFVYSNIIGRVLLDVLNKEVSVHPLAHRVNVPQVGSIVTGQVSSVSSKSATLRISKIGKKILTGFFTGLLHISAVSPRYVETMFEVCKAGDIMRAKVISDKNRTYQLSTSDTNLGVISAFCSRCGYVLSSRRRQMFCPECEKIERRKTASDYGREIEGSADQHFEGNTT